MNPLYHSKSSVKRWGGNVEDYIELHELLDSPKATMNNNTSRNSDGKSVDTVDIAMLHVSEDFKHRFIPTAQDYLKHLDVQPWMCNGVKKVDNPDSIQAAIDLREKLKADLVD